MSDKNLVLTEEGELIAEDPETGDREPVPFAEIVANQLDVTELFELPTATEGDTVDSERSIAIDPDEGVLLIPDPDSGDLE